MSRFAVPILSAILIGCSSNPTPTGEDEATKPVATESSALDSSDLEAAKSVVRQFVASVRTGSKDEQVKSVLALLPTDEEITIAFPAHAKDVKKYYAMVREEIPKSSKLGRKEEPADIVAIEITNVRDDKKSEGRKLLKILAPNVAVVAPYVKRKNGEGPSQPLIRVKGRWIVLLEGTDLLEFLKLQSDPR